VVSKRWVMMLAMFGAAICVLSGAVEAQGQVDTMTLTPMPPDSFYLRRSGGNVVIGWYPPAAAISTVIGSRDFTNWYGEHNTTDGVNVTFSGTYADGIDRTLIIEKLDRTAYTVGTSPSIPLRIGTVDMFNRTYERIINIGTDTYAPDDPVPAILRRIGLEPGEVADTLFLGFDMHFSAGTIDTSYTGAPASFILDLQSFEGFHVWRGITPYPSEMQAIVEISKEDYFRVSNITAVEDVPVKWVWLWEYFNDTGEPAWPRRDALGRKYYEWVDENAFVGFTYYYVVTTYDRGYYKGFDLYNKLDNFVCDEDPENPVVPGHPVLCDDVAKSYVMTVDVGRNINDVYAVPNPYRTGTSAESTPYYHNFPDGTIKFYNVPRESTIKIFTVSGDLIWEGSHTSPDGSNGVISWNVRNKNGQDVTSGVYVYRVESSTGEDVYGRIVVIR
jgi:hypothetical protein